MCSDGGVFGVRCRYCSLVCPRCAIANASIMLGVPCVVQDWEKIYSDTMAIDSLKVIRRRVSTNVGIHTFSAESLIAHQIGAADDFPD